MAQEVRKKSAHQRVVVVLQAIHQEMMSLKHLDQPWAKQWDVDRVLVIERGQLTETGTQEELLSQRGLYFQLYSHGIGSHG